MRVVLASSSKQRKDIFDMIGLKYDIIVSDVEEESNKKRPGDYVKELSFNKANCVKDKLDSEAIIISADTIMYYNGRKYEKPKTKEEAYQNILELSGKKSYCYTGITIMDLYKNKTTSFSSKIDVYFREVSEEEAKWYANNEGKVFKCCGYVPLGKASLFIDKTVGDYNTLIGISPKLVFDKLKEFGYTINDFEWVSVNEN